MAYLALYRAYRPANFSDVVGQDHIVTVLKSQISRGRVAHAYLFSGPRGTGKTSCAKIFAKAINCKQPNGVEPCGICDICVGVVNDNCMDVIEIDAASNNGVDNIRDIREKANLLPAMAKYKVYIIDEVHMLSAGAFNALLKTLEEPPSHVVFILATTEPKKIPATIHSRCQRYDFKRLAVNDIVSRLKYVADSQSIDCDDEALITIARAAMGAMRDALSILDQCATDKKLTADSVLTVLGGASRHELLALLKHITDYDEKNAIIKLEQIKDSGADIKMLLKDLAYLFKGMLFLIKGATPLVAGVFNQEAVALKEMGTAFGQNALQRALEILIENETMLRTNAMPEIVLQLSVIKIMNQHVDEKTSQTARLEQVEAKIAHLKKNGINVQPTEINNSIVQKTISEAPAKPKPAKAKQKKNYHLSADNKNMWDNVVTEVHISSVGLYPYLTSLVLVGVEKDKLLFTTDKSMTFNYLSSNMDALKKFINKVYDQDLGVGIELVDKNEEVVKSDYFAPDMFGDMVVKEI
jgi:DNA polymerase III subunit gamma/tau